MPPGTKVTGKLVSALRKLGFDFVFGTSIPPHPPKKKELVVVCIYTHTPIYISDVYCCTTFHESASF